MLSLDQKPVSALLTDGQKLYSEKKYLAAIESFTKAAKLYKNGSKADVLQILDFRIGALVKVSRLDSAMKDARSMVKLVRTDARGYARCGQIARLTENYENAVKWYEQGLKNTPSTDQMHSYLQKQKLKNQNLRSQKVLLSKPQDPLMALPVEVVEIFLSYLEYRQLVAILRVSRSWKAFISRTPQLSQTLDFHDAKRQITYSMLSASIRRLTKRPRKINLANLTPSASAQFKARHQGWIYDTSLQDYQCSDPNIRIDCSRFLKSSLTSIILGSQSTISFHELNKVLESCQQLVTARFAAVNTSRSSEDGLWEELTGHDSLETFELGGPLFGDPLHVAIDFEQLPNLTELICRTCRLYSTENEKKSKLKTVKLEECWLQGVFNFGPSIRTLKLRDCKIAAESILSDECMPHLQILDLIGTSPGSSLVDSITEEGSTGSLLQLSFDLDLLYRMPGFHCLNNLARVGTLNAVERLHIVSQEIHDGMAPLFSQNPPALENLVIENAPITGVFLKKLIEMPSSKLNQILLKNCRNVSPDIVEWAQKKGVQILFKISNENVLGGRRIHS